MVKNYTGKSCVLALSPIDTGPPSLMIHFSIDVDSDGHSRMLKAELQELYFLNTYIGLAWLDTVYVCIFNTRRSAVSHCGSWGNIQKVL